MPGYDLVAMNRDHTRLARIQIKSRWKTRAEGFIIKNFDCDFVVIVKLNRGSKDGSAEILPPEYFVLPVTVAKSLPRSKGWGKVSITKIPNLQSYRDKWNLVINFLKTSNK
jgi:hypothetical protein